MILYFTCPKCNKDFMKYGYWRWILTTPFHWFGKRYTRCPHCEKKSYMAWHTIRRS